MAKPIAATPMVFGADADRIRSAMAKSSVLTPAQKQARREGIKAARKLFTTAGNAALALVAEAPASAPAAHKTPVG